MNAWEKKNTKQLGEQKFKLNKFKNGKKIFKEVLFIAFYCILCAPNLQLKPLKFNALIHLKSKINVDISDYIWHPEEF